MIDYINIKGYSIDTGYDLSMRYKAGTTLYMNQEPGEDKSEIIIVKFKTKKAWCRYYEKNYGSSGKSEIDYNIRGSLQRFTTGKSYTDFHYLDVPKALMTMCEECRFNISKPHRIMMIELGVNLTMSCDPDDFLTIFKLYWGSGFHEMRVLSGEHRPHGIERVLSDMYKIKIYNKTIYARRVEKLSPLPNRLRVEVQFLPRAIKEYELPATVQELCDKAQFQKYVDKFCEIIKSINTADWIHDISDLKGLNLRNYLFMHGDTRLYNEYLKRIEGNRKAVECEKCRLAKIEALLKGRKTLKEEFIKKFDAKVRKLTQPKKV